MLDSIDRIIDDEIERIRNETTRIGNEIERTDNEIQRIGNKIESLLNLEITIATHIRKRLLITNAVRIDLAALTAYWVLCSRRTRP